MIKIGIIEDEPGMRQAVCDYIKQAGKKYPEIRCHAYESGEAFFRENKKYDILILDIDLPGINGIDLARTLRSQGDETELIYLTAYSEYAAESYLVDAYQYVLKECMEQRLSQVLERLIVKKLESKRDYRLIGINGGNKRLFYRDIFFIQKHMKGGKYVEYVTESGVYKERIAMRRLMAELEDLRFIMLDRGHVVNAQYIEKLEHGMVYLTTGDAFPLSRIQLTNAKQQILRYLEKE